MAYSRKKLDLTGQKFGKLAVLGPAENIGSRTAWRCQCDCGRETVVKTGPAQRPHEKLRLYARAGRAEIRPGPDLHRRNLCGDAGGQNRPPKQYQRSARGGLETVQAILAGVYLLQGAAVLPGQLPEF